MFFEQYSQEPYVATPRYIEKHLPPDHRRRAELPDRLAKGRAALELMDGHLASHSFLVAERFTIAGIALYACPRFAEQGGTPSLCERAQMARARRAATRVRRDLRAAASA